VICRYVYNVFILNFMFLDNVSLVITVKHKAKNENICTVAVSLFYILQKINLTKVTCFS